VSKYKTCSDCGQFWDTEAPHGHDCPGSPGDRLDDVVEDLRTLNVRLVRLEERLDGEKADGPTFTLPQVLQVLTNVGIDVTCGGCVSLAMTGFGGYAHKEGCENAPSEPVIMSLTDKARCPKRDSGGIQCELPAGHEGLCACPEALDKWKKRRAT